jgi:tRNA-splicing ligase RtcB
MRREDLIKLSDTLFEIPRSYRGDMRVPGRIYADEYLLGDILGDESLEQVANVATLPSVIGAALAMPDIHQGYGFPVGGVAAMRWEEGIISPGGIGFDINCGVRVLTSSLRADEVKPRLEELARALYQRVPSGVGAGGRLRLSRTELEEVLEKGARYMLKRGWAEKRDLEFCEAGGSLPQADARAVSEVAKRRGRNQCGTLGSGNHFLELQQVAKIFHRKAARALGFFEGQLCVMIHSGSRGLGYQVCTDYLRQVRQTYPRVVAKLPDAQLMYAPLNSEVGRNYWAALAAAANFAFANRQYMTHLTREVFRDVLGREFRDVSLGLVYDVAHNIAKEEEAEWEGRRFRACVHRKGATRAFAPGDPELPAAYRKWGQPVLIPGSMGTASYVLLGREGARKRSFSSVCHGAGRVMSRAEAKRRVRGQELVEQLKKRGVLVFSGSMPGVAEEAPQAYKDVERVVDVVARAGLAQKVVRLEPLAVIKG